MALSVPLSRFTSRIGGGSAFFVGHITRMEIHHTDSWRLARQLCPCCGQGGLVFSSCPTCSAVVLICGEVGTVFEIRGRECGSVLGDFQRDFCPKCGKSRFSDFRDATSDEIVALGFQAGDYR